MASVAKLFIGSSKESREIAGALQENLEGEIECTVWNQLGDTLSRHIYEVLEQAASDHDFAAFVFAHDDRLVMRGRSTSVTRDNVVFELGLFSGVLGRERTFIVAPTGPAKLHLPTDLTGIGYAGYNSERSDGNIVAALGTAATKIVRHVRAALLRGAPPKLHWSGWFSQSQFLYPRLLSTAKDVSLYFIHSRRWREDNDTNLRKFLERAGTTLRVVLPNLRNTALMRSLQKHFDDGPHIPGFVSDAYRYFKLLKRKHPTKVAIYPFEVYPTYSFYKFDEQLVIAMYPTTPLRRDVPTFMCSITHPYGRFVEEDLAILIPADAGGI